MATPTPETLSHTGLVEDWHRLMNALARISYCDAQTGKDAMKMRNIAFSVVWPEKAHIYDPPSEVTGTAN